MKPAIKFFNPDEEIIRREHNLPHWQQAGDGVCYFVTWRLGDSLPQEKLNQWKYELEIWNKLNPKPWNSEQENEYRIRFPGRLESWIDDGYGSCRLRVPAAAQIMHEVFLFRDKVEYDINAFVVMPNHVHVLFQLKTGSDLGKVLRAWKGISARRINQLFNLSGALWDDDYWDRMIRNGEHFYWCKRYIEKNPIRAKLKEGEFLLYMQ